ncbi:peptidoglycan-binding protein, partial [Pseudomonas sp. 2995-1]|uniref:peptidoglycan-binding domain-containing protein n=1 Tax=Pseudomonas sp. 2995-1 TaxID=1712679 RepID=UPI0015B21378
HISSNPTTYFGSSTEAVVKEFQTYYGLEVTGKVGQETLAKLDEILTSPLRNGERHESSIQLKLDLSMLGYHVSDNPTTFYGSTTEAMVRDFQADHGLRVNGIADQVTLAKLEELVTKPMQFGMRRSDVITLKEDLEVAGFHISNNPTTYFGPSTEAVVKEFQTYYGLE